jgi:hypothetical protein
MGKKVNINCFELTNSGHPHGGIHCFSSGVRVVLLQVNGCSFEVPLINEVKKGWPKLSRNADYVISASPSYLRTRALAGRGNWDGAIVKIATASLDFSSNKAHAVMKIGNVWAGAETLHGAYVQVGSRKHQLQQQLIIVEAGVTTYVADHSARYIGLRWDSPYHVATPIPWTV